MFFDWKLDFNLRNGVCWCVVRGYEDIDKIFFGVDYVFWMYIYGYKMRIFIDQFIIYINLN